MKALDGKNSEDLSKALGLSKVKRGANTETIKRRGTGSPGPVCSQKSQVPSNGDKARKQKQREDEEVGECWANQPTL